jgi:hypothetical protein
MYIVVGGKGVKPGINPSYIQAFNGLCLCWVLQSVRELPWFGKSEMAGIPKKRVGKANQRR